jgi:hypothetical protein
VVHTWYKCFEVCSNRELDESLLSHASEQSRLKQAKAGALDK